MLGDKEIEDVLQKLNRIAAEEAQIRGTQILAAVYELVRNMATVMEGTHIGLCGGFFILTMIRRKDDRKTTRRAWYIILLWVNGHG